MRPAALTSSDYMSLYSGSSYGTTSPRSPSTNYRKPYEYSFNSPKAETQKNFAYTTRNRNDSPKYAPKSEKVAESPLEKRNAKSRDFSASRVQTFASTHSGFYDPEKEDKKSPYDSYKNATNFGQNVSFRNTSTSSPLSRSVFIKEATREDSNILTRKKYDADSSPSNNLRNSSEFRPQSSKNTESRDRYDDSNSKKSVTYYPLDEFISKYSTVKTPSYRNNADKNDSPNRPLTLNRFMAETPTKESPSALRNSSYLDTSNDSKYTPTSVKHNTFFDRLNSKNDSSETPKSQKLLHSASQFEYKKYDYKDNFDYTPNSDKPLLTRSELNFRKTFSKASDVEEDTYSKGPSYRTYEENKEKTTNAYWGQSSQHGNGDKPSLDSFVTKVERGVAFQPLKRLDIKAETKETRYGNNYSYYADEEKTSKTDRVEKDSPFRLSQSILNKDSKFFKTPTKSTYEADTSYSGEVNRWTGKSTRPSTARNDESTDGSQDGDYYQKPSVTYYITDLEKFLTSRYDRDYFGQIYREHFQQSFQTLKFCKYMKPTDPKNLAKKKQYLTKKDCYKNKKTLVFDLDETLIHCNDSPLKRSDVKLPIKFPGGETIEAGINIRPYAIDILKELSQHFELIIFTASHKSYANVVIDHLDPHKQYIQHRLYRDSCIFTDEGVYVKDLRVFANRNLQDLILVDNAAYSYAFQLDNGVPIIPFYENKEDQELKKLIPYLMRLGKAKDIRDINKKTFNFHLYSQYDSSQDVLENVICKN